MKYLLSDGRSTTDFLVYIKDVLKLNFVLRIDEIPYWNGGSEELIYKLTEEEIKSKINLIINSIIDKLNIKYDGVLKLAVNKIQFNSTQVHIEISINNNIESYDIQRAV